MTYRNPSTTSEYSTGILKHTVNRCIDTFLLLKIDLGRANNTIKNIYTSITRLTPDIVQSLELSKTFQKITRDKNSLIPYFKKKISDYDDKNHIELDKPTFLHPRPRWIWCLRNIRNILLFYVSSRNYFLCQFFQVPNSPSCAIITDTFTRNFTTINI